MASGWNLCVVIRRWVWLECIGVFSGWWCMEVYRFPHFSSLLHLYKLFFTTASLLLCSFFSFLFMLFLCNIANVAQRMFKIVQKSR